MFIVNVPFWPRASLYDDGVTFIHLSETPVTSALTEVNVDVPKFVTSTLIVPLSSFSIITSGGADISIFLITEPPPPPPPLLPPEEVVVVGHAASPALQS